MMGRIFLLLCVAVSVVYVDALNTIASKAIYKIKNKADDGYLTASLDGDDQKVRIQRWTDSAGQKWKSKLPKLSSSFEFIPTSDDGTRLDADKSGISVFARASSGTNTKYWYVNDEGEGTFAIQSYSQSSCVTSQGLGKPVTLQDCTNSPQQEWMFVEI